MDAEPEASGTVDSGCPSRKKATVPVTVPPPGATGTTVAVNVTGWPETEGLAEVETVVWVFDGLTTWVGSEPVLVAKRVTPA